MKRVAKVLGAGAGVTAAGIYGWSLYTKPAPLARHQGRDTVPSREDHMSRLKSNAEYDVLVIGGGATGCGIAIDAATRGLSVALVERNDFASGTSSRSTKLLHGGIRYLEKAIKHLDYSEFKLVTEALHERTRLLHNAPHLTRPLPIILPVRSWIDAPQYWVGLKMYDLIAGGSGMPWSYYLSVPRARNIFPTLNPEGLKCTVVYYDGQMNDARLNVSLALTAASHGATVSNHTEVQSLLKTADGTVNGAVIKDTLTNELFSVRAKLVINATGAFSDEVRRMDDPETRTLVAPSVGAHIILPEYLCPHDYGMVDAKTSDGRVIFILPFEGRTLAGTTDKPCKLEPSPKPTEEDINFILDYVRQYTHPSIQVKRSDVLSAWTGIRPLSLDPNHPDTTQLSRNHIVIESKSGLVTIVGGKWTTYRRMAYDTMERALMQGKVKPSRASSTDNLAIWGADDYTPILYIKLMQDYGLEQDIALHLSHSYGDKAPLVAEIAKNGYGARLADNLPYIEAEVIYSTKEYAATCTDVMAHRTRLAFLDHKYAKAAVPKVAEILAKQLNWTEARKQTEIKNTYAFLDTMHSPFEQ